MRTIWQKQLLVALALIGLTCSSQGQSLSSESSLSRARKLWELAIAAKGGRDALHKIRTIAEIRDDKGKNVTFIALPDKYFSWFDARPGQFGLDIKLYNFENGFGFRNSGLSGAKHYSDIRTHADFTLVKGRLNELMYSQLFWLLETRWMQPKPIAALKDRVNGKSVDRVDVLIEGYGAPKRFAIYLDEKTHLPVRIAMCRAVNSQEISDFCCFSNKRAYVEMAGVQIPVESSGKNTLWGRDHIELNSEYAPQFFDRPPDLNSDGLQWRKAGTLPVPQPVVSESAPLTSAELARPSQKTAKELWELAIVAKGGREALYKVTNIAEIRKADGSNVRFTALPNKFFSWVDMRPSIFGISIDLYNYETGFGYRTLLREERRTYQNIRTDPDFKWVKGQHEYLLWPQFFLLLETRWLQPTPFRLVKERINGKSVDRIDVLIEGYGDPKRFAVFLDEKTHLPARIAMCRNVNTDEITDVCCFSNLRGYVEIEGVKIPLESSGQRDSKWVRKQVEINTKYDPRFFDRPPDHNAGGLQWRTTGANLINPPLVSQPEVLTPAQIAQFIKDLDSPDEELRQASLRDLVTAGKQVVPALAKALASSSNSLHRYNLAVALLEIEEENPPALAALVELVPDTGLPPQARQDAAFGLLRNATGITALIELLKNPDPITRRFALFSFDELTERSKIPQEVEKALPALRELTRDKDEVIRMMAKEVLEQIGSRFKR
jgi:hypothetical protein